MDEEKKTPWSLILALMAIFFVVIIILFALQPQSTTTASISGLSVKLFSNTTLKSNSYFTFNSTILNTYDASLQNVRAWLEAGSLFYFSNSRLSNSTTLRIFNFLLPKGNISYVLSNIKVESISTEMKKIPIDLKILYFLQIDQPFTINVVRNDSLQTYGGKENVGIFYKTPKVPISISFNFDKNSFIYSKGKNEVAKFTILIKNSNAGKCIDNLKILMNANNNLSCKLLDKTLAGNFETYQNFSEKLEIPCNYTLKYLDTKDFDSLPFKMQISCNYLEKKAFYFNILP